MTNSLEPVTPVAAHLLSGAKAFAPPCRYNDTVSRIAPRRPRVSASIGAALGALALACAAPSALGAEVPPPPPASQGVDLQLGNLLRLTLQPTDTPGQTNLPINLLLDVPSVLSLKVNTGLGLTTPAGPGANLGVQVPLGVDLSTPVGGVNLDVNANVDASLLNGEDVVAAKANIDVNAEADLLGLDTELGANVAANVAVGKNTVIDVKTDLRLPPELERIVKPAGSPVKPLPVGSQTVTPPVVEQPPAVDPTPPTPPTPTPPVDQPEPPKPIDPTPPKPPVAVPPVAVDTPVVEVPVFQPSAPPPLERLRDVAVAAGRSIWLPLGLMLALFAYLLGQRLLDGGAKLASAARSATPDDEIIEL
ncbi:MAG: hypothetical protein QOD86_1931 [Miltoncostaeaceae bacterium]|jgi:outer membrane biosynthesis protein TonB|nr:hypothetical protein [Miltoncostaeaceae bacterium]